MNNYYNIIDKTTRKLDLIFCGKQHWPDFTSNPLNGLKPLKDVNK